MIIIHARNRIKKLQESSSLSIGCSYANNLWRISNRDTISTIGNNRIESITQIFAIPSADWLTDRANDQPIEHFPYDSIHTITKGKLRRHLRWTSSSLQLVIVWARHQEDLKTLSSVRLVWPQNRTNKRRVRVFPFSRSRILHANKQSNRRLATGAYSPTGLFVFTHSVLSQLADLQSNRSCPKQVARCPKLETSKQKLTNLDLNSQNLT